MIRKLLRRFGYLASFDPQSYWQNRHVAHSDALTGVGHICLTNEQNKLDYQLKMREIISALATSVGDLKGKRILDAGCGIGVFSAALLAEGAHVFGVDFSPKAIDFARRVTPGGTFNVASLETLPFKDEFDCVICIDVLFHVVDSTKWENALSSLLSALKPDGVLLIQEEFGALDRAVHVRWRTQEDYAAKCDKLGAKICSSYSYRLPEEKVTKTILVISRARETFDETRC
jgi:SAM-dependent methyltransferase